MLTLNDLKSLISYHGREEAEQYIKNYPEREKELRANTERTAVENSQNLTDNAFFRLGIHGDPAKIAEEFKNNGVKIQILSENTPSEPEKWSIAKVFDQQKLYDDAKKAFGEYAYDEVIQNDTPLYELRSPLLSKENAAKEIQGAVQAIHQANGRIKGMIAPIYPSQLSPIAHSSPKEYDTRIDKALNNMDDNFKKSFKKLASKAQDQQDTADLEECNDDGEEFIYRGSSIFNNPYGIISEYPNRGIAYAATDFLNASEYALNCEGSEDALNQEAIGIIYRYKIAEDQKYFAGSSLKGGNEISGASAMGNKEETFVSPDKNPCVGKILVFKNEKMAEIPKNAKWEKFLSSIASEDSQDGKHFANHHNAAMKNEKTYDYFTLNKDAQTKEKEAISDEHIPENTKANRLQQLRGLGAHQAAPYKPHPSNEKQIDMGRLQMAQNVASNFRS